MTDGNPGQSETPAPDPRHVVFELWIKLIGKRFPHDIVFCLCDISCEKCLTNTQRNMHEDGRCFPCSSQCTAFFNSKACEEEACMCDEEASGVSAQSEKMFLTHAFFLETMCDLFISLYSGYPGLSLDIYRLSMGYL